MWLSGRSTPDFRTINDFRSKCLKNCIHSLFTQIVLMLVELGYISLEKKIRCILFQIEEGFLYDNNAPEESPFPIDSRSLKKR